MSEVTPLFAGVEKFKQELKAERGIDLEDYEISDEEFFKPCSEVVPVCDPSSFPEVIPLDTDPALPEFPLDALPSSVREYIQGSSKQIQALVDMVGSCVLGVLSIACRGRYPVQLPGEHTERPCLYIVPIATPSERKSAVIKEVTKALNNHERKYNKTHKTEIDLSRNKLSLLYKQKAEAENRVAKEKDYEKRAVAEDEVYRFSEKISNFEVLHSLRLFGADCTPEKLCQLLKEQNQVFALVSGEGGGIFENINRYSEKGGLEIYLNGYSGDKVVVDRKSSESITVENPTLNIIALCQPSVATVLFLNKEFRERGLLSRLLYVKCSSLAGKRTPVAAPMDPRIAAAYDNLVAKMLSTESYGNLTFDDEGFRVYTDFFKEIEAQLTPNTGRLTHMVDWAGKCPGIMVRLAGLIHCMVSFEQNKDPLDTQINASEARAAVELARYFLAHAEAVYSEEAEPLATKHAKYLWGKITSLYSPPAPITKSALTRGTQNKKYFSLDDSLAELVRRGYIKIIKKEETGGRPFELIVPNPKIQN